MGPSATRIQGAAALGPVDRFGARWHVLRSASGAPSAKLKKGMRVTCEVVAVKDSGLEVKLVDHDLTSFVRRSDLSRDRSEQRPDRFGVGEKFDAVVTQVDAKARKVSVSIKALEIAEEKEAVAQYGSTDSGA